MTKLQVPDVGERESLGTFVARLVRLDAQAVVRLRARGDGIVDAWAKTPFDVLATRSVVGEVDPRDLTVSGNELLAALSVAGGELMNPGRPQDLMWRSELPGGAGFRFVEELPVHVVTDVTDRGLAVARENLGPKGTPPTSLLDQEVLTVSDEDTELKISLRCLFALAGMGFTGSADDRVRVSANSGWLRLDARYGAVLRQRRSLLPLVF
ncbi:hypothetical protein SAMN06265360_111132 [Haloechinothrix alba]|uniref:Uncharacterized protein n=1 Tax=Haloechinothrix alba TaxID=664784 RepID=A0A238XNW6_9PSEU|nr:hypothetical protein [Haloechinothrix alba]SNR60133.1 hypothetical protein SAMN06265360_111132 [Haloechinothrix alba]